jgi:hypothetical protein
MTVAEQRENDSAGTTQDSGRTKRKADGPDSQVLTLNAGSSSLKFALFDLTADEPRG